MTSKKNVVSGKAVDVSVLKKIVKYLVPYKKQFTVSIIVSIALAITTPLRPYLVQYTIDNYIVKKDSHMLLIMTLVLVSMLIVESALQFFDTFIQNKIGQLVIKDIRSDLYKHVIKLRLKYFDNTPIGMLVTRVVSDIETISDIFSDGLVVIMGDILKLVIVIALMFYTNVNLTLISLLTIPVLLISANIFKNGVKKSFQEVRTQVARLNTFVQEHITGVTIVQIFNREKKELEKFKEINAQHRDANIKSIWYYSVFFPVVEILSSISIGLLVWWGGKGILSSSVTVGEIIAFIMYINMMFRPIRQLADRFNTLQMGMVGSERVFKVLETDETISNKGTYKPTEMNGTIEFKNVSFAYTNNNYVLQDISFTAVSGKTIALVGATGSGKSTIINLINRFYEFEAGDILIDGISIKEFENKELQKHISLVLQDVFLFSDTIYNNITLHNPKITMDMVIDASKAIGAHSFIMQLPNNYNYQVMERGNMLSVGQRQLIAFIRAYVYNPSILILDEATSSIDTESEQAIQFATDKLTTNRTCIIVAHRLATIQKADRIIVLDKGRIVEEGSHKELLLKNGFYKNLFDAQFNTDAT